MYVAILVKTSNANIQDKNDKQNYADDNGQIFWTSNFSDVVHA